MSDFLQLNVKRRQTNGFFDSLIEEFNRYQDDPQKIGSKLKEKVKDWLVTEEELSDPPVASDSVTPLSIGAAIENRVCEIAGHVWLEFVQGTGEDSIRGTAYSQRRNTINAHVAEFIPEIEIDAILEAFETGGSREIPWINITNKNLLELLGPLLRESQDGRKPVFPTARRPAGLLNGYMNLIFPEELRGQGDVWFQDRMDADITPSWRIDEPVVITDSIEQTASGERYSFTPEHYKRADNCVSWALRALDRLVLDDSLDTLRARCGITQPRCGLDRAPLPPKPCEDLHIRDQGRMKCIAGYASKADEQRRAGLKIF